MLVTVVAPAGEAMTTIMVTPGVIRRGSSLASFR
jgi:hypothetical protein